MKKFVPLLLAFVMLLGLTACGEGGLSLNGSNSSDKEGYIGDTLSTYWFDFSVDDAYSCSSYHDYTASAGKKLVVASITLKNTCGASVDMWGDDFVILWDTGDDDVDMEFALPGGLSDRQFPDEYTLSEGKVKSTSDRGVKKTLKPCAYKRSELFSAVTACLLHNEPASCRRRRG